MNTPFKFFGFLAEQPYIQNSNSYIELDYFITEYNNMCVKRFFSRICEGGFGNIQNKFGDM